MFYVYLCVGFVIILFRFVMSLSRLLNCLMIMENLNILLLMVCLANQADETRIIFLALMVLFTVEVALRLVMLTRL